MKIKKLTKYRPAALAALGVFLGRGAQADTIIDFDTAVQPRNSAIVQPFGSYVTATTEGVTVTGFGTPNIGVLWTATGDPATRWEYYNDSVWTAGQLGNSILGSAFDLTFVPNGPTAQTVIKSFNFHPYYAFVDTGERFTFDVSVLSGTNVLSGPMHVTFQTDGTKNHPVNVNYTGTAGQILKLRIERVASTLGAGEVEGAPGDIAVDDITFAQLPTSEVPTGPQVVSVKPFDDQEGVAAGNYSYLASITNGASSVASGSIRLAFDGTQVTPTITSAAGLTNVSYSATALLPAGSTHFYTLSYDDSGGAHYTNYSVFKVANYVTIPPSYASPPGSGSRTGFVFRSVAVYADNTNNLDTTVARAKSQLAGTLIDPATNLPYTNSATLGTNADGSWNINTVLNFNDNGVNAGNFSDDSLFPGLDVGPYNNFSTESRLYLDLTAGYYRLGVNSDDGFEFSVAPQQGLPGSPIVLGVYDNGRSASDTLFDFVVQSNGVYCFKLIYFEGVGDASLELFSVDLATGTKILINDPLTAGSIKSYLVIPPRITSITKVGSNVVINWVDGFPPFQVQVKTNLADTVWSNSGSPTNVRTATVPITGNSGFIRVVGSP